MNMPDDIKQWRKAQRAELLTARLAISPAQRQQCNASITAFLAELTPVLQRKVVSFYWPYQGEFDPRIAIHHLRTRGATVALPEVLRKAAPLQFRQWWPGVSMTRGVLDLPVPDGTSVVAPDASFIPPVGFDPQGFRLGYGGGFFDRTLAVAQPQPLKIGVAFELSRIASIRPQPHDIPMDLIVTEAGIHCVGGSGLERVTDPLDALEFSTKLILERARRHGE